jgi:hypothetical protein
MPMTSMLMLVIILSWTAFAWAEHTPSFDTCEQAAASVESIVKEMAKTIATKQPNPTPAQLDERPKQLNDVRCSAEEDAYAHVRQEHAGPLCPRTSTALGLTCPR